MGSKFTRRRFLTAVSSGAAYLALTNTVGCEPTRPNRATGSPGRPEQTWAFRSRPDLSPPAIELTARAHNTAPGYIFVAPEKGGAGQGGSMILDDSGQVVWFRPLQGTHGRVMNLKVQTYRGERVLTWMERLDEYVIFDDSYREIKRLRAGNGYNGDHHEFLISPQDTALITIYSPVPWDLSPVGGLKEDRVWQGIVQELDIESGEVLFEWHSLEHVGLEETYATLLQDGERSGFDYFHINSIDIDHDGNLLISARETFTVYKVDRKTGEVMWRLGGKKSDFEMGPGTQFAYQHDARRQRDGTITIFDNGNTVFHKGIPEAIEESRGIVLELDEEKMKATLVREYKHPDKMFAHAAGNMQVLPNGNVFIGWGRALVFSEFSKEGELLYSASFPPSFSLEDGTYRAFRFPWSGRPGGDPAVAVRRRRGDGVKLYPSWNGATEVATWEVLAGPRPGHLESLGSVPRDGFETALLATTSRSYVAVRAKHASGRVLGASKPVESGG